jgi:hypothetical protein
MQNLPDVHVAQQTVSNLRGEPQFTLLDKLLEKMSPRYVAPGAHAALWHEAGLI